MNKLTAFMVLIERRIGRKLLSALLVLAQLIGLLHAPSAVAGIAYGKARKVAGRSEEPRLNSSHLRLSRMPSSA